MGWEYQGDRGAQGRVGIANKNREVPRDSVAEPEPQGAGTFAGAGAIIMVQLSAPAPAPAPAPCYKLGILKSSEKSILKRKNSTGAGVGAGVEPKLSERLEPELQKIVPAPQHCLENSRISRIQGSIFLKYRRLCSKGERSREKFALSRVGSTMWSCEYHEDRGI